MSAKRVIRLESARQDERDAVRYYAREAGLEVALRFNAALRDAYRTIGDRPASGSRHYADVLGIRRLRSRKLGRFPFLIFYVEEEGHVDIWRILHAQRDIGPLLAETMDEDEA